MMKMNRPGPSTLFLMVLLMKTLMMMKRKKMRTMGMVLLCAGKEGGTLFLQSHFERVWQGQGPMVLLLMILMVLMVLMGLVR